MTPITSNPAQFQSIADKLSGNVYSSFVQDKESGRLLISKVKYLANGEIQPLRDQHLNWINTDAFALKHPEQFKAAVSSGQIDPKLAQIPDGFMDLVNHKIDKLNGLSTTPPAHSLLEIKFNAFKNMLGLGENFAKDAAHTATETAQKATQTIAENGSWLLNHLPEAGLAGAAAVGLGWVGSQLPGWLAKNPQAAQQIEATAVKTTRQLSKAV